MPKKSTYPFLQMHHAFGYLLAECIYQTGKTHHVPGVVSNNTVVITKTKPLESIWLQTKGTSTLTEINTGVIEKWTEGDSDLTNPCKLGSWQAEYTEDVAIWCLPKNMTNDLNDPNKDIDLTKITQFTLLDTQTTTIPNNTKLFLASGSLTINGQSYPGPQQIEVLTGDKSVTATGDCYGFIFP
jgi:hypothetical protein